MLPGKLNSKFSLDILWNLASFGLAGVVFILTNTILLKAYSKDVVGVFNEVYAVYMILAQLAVFGLHLSVLYYIPRYSKRKAHSDVILTASLLAALVLSGGLVGVAWLLREVPGALMDSEGVKEAFQYAVWGLLFFSLNKVLIAFHNGFRRMKAVAVFQSLRIGGMLAVLVLLLWLETEPTFVVSILSFAEVILFVILSAYTLRFYTPAFGVRFIKWLIIHLRFGFRALFGNLLLDINTRVDVIMLGIFLDDGQVGIYSFALAIAEGVIQVPVIFRNNINPIITKARDMERSAANIVNRLLRRNLIAFYKIIGALALVCIALFPLGLWVLQIEEHNTEYWVIFSILIGAVATVAGYLPFQMVFNQLGKPALQTYFILPVFCVNVVGNLIFIQLFGIYGAAMGTAISMISKAIFLRFMLRKYTDFRI